MFGRLLELSVANFAAASATGSIDIFGFSQDMAVAAVDGVVGVSTAGASFLPLIVTVKLAVSVPPSPSLTV